MPLLTSPIDGSPMRQIHRYGIEIDVCPTSGGIWLDKGEIEKLMALLKEETINDHSRPYRQDDEPRRARRRYNDREDDDDDDGDDDRGFGGVRRNGGGISRIMDIFEF